MRWRDYVLKCGSVSLEDMADHFKVSLNTVRRDLSELLERGKIKKVYGGVTVSELTESMVLSKREMTDTTAKQAIGKVAAQLIKDNSTVFIDSGTTTVQVLPFLSNKSNVTIITNSLKAMYETAKHKNLDLLALGGYYNYSHGNFVANSSAESMTKLNFDLVLIAATCISLSNGLSVNSYFEVDVKNRIVKNNVGHIALLATADKFDKSALYSFCEFDEVNTIVADRPLPEHYIERMNSKGITFLCPETK